MVKMEFVKKKKKSLKLGLMPISVTKTEMFPLFAEKKKKKQNICMHSIA